MLSAPTNAKKIAWQQTHVFWGDERWVAPSHHDSNFGLAREELLVNIPIPPHNIHPIATDFSSPEIAAEKYENDLREFFHMIFPAETTDSADGQLMPSFDLVLLGMGEDGHTASLFPASEILEEKKKWVAAVSQETGRPRIARITLTLPILNQAGNVLFLIAGNRKKEVLNTFVTCPKKAEKLYPAARIKPHGNLIWLVAEQA